MDSSIIWGADILTVALALIVAIAIGLVYDATQVLRARKARNAARACAVVVGLATISVCAVVSFAREREWKHAYAEIHETVCAIRRDVANNDFEHALAFVSENATQTRALVSRNRGAVKVKDATISDFKIVEIDLNEKPPRATVSFRVSVKGTASAWPTPIRLPYRLELELDGVEFRREKDGVWRLQDRYVVKSTAL